MTRLPESRLGRQQVLLGSSPLLGKSSCLLLSTRQVTVLGGPGPTRRLPVALFLSSVYRHLPLLPGHVGALAVCGDTRPPSAVRAPTHTLMPLPMPLTLGARGGPPAAPLWLGMRRPACVLSMDTRSDPSLLLPCLSLSPASLSQRRVAIARWYALQPCPLTQKAVQTSLPTLGFLVICRRSPHENRVRSADENMKHMSWFWLWGRSRGHCDTAPSALCPGWG